MESLIGLAGPLHPAFAHFPIVCSILSAFACLAYAYSRKAWLTEASAWLWILTFISASASAISGHFFSLTLGLVDHFSPLPPESIRHGLLRDHVLWGGAGLITAGLLCSAGISQLRRKPWTLSLQLLLSLSCAVFFGLTGQHGGEMVFGGETPGKEAPAASGDILKQVEGYQKNLVKMNSQPWNSRTHGHRWVNTYVSKEAVEAYKNGAALPERSWVVKESFEDEGGKASRSPGPLYVMRKGKNSDSPETNGWLFALSYEKPAAGNPENILSPVRWLPGDSHLSSCVKCHQHFKSTDYLGGIPEGFENH